MPPQTHEPPDTGGSSRQAGDCAHVAHPSPPGRAAAGLDGTHGRHGRGVHRHRKPLPQRWVMTAQRILFGLLVVVAAAAAVLSFAALRDLALVCGFSAQLAWLLPLV